MKPKRIFLVRHGEFHILELQEYNGKYKIITELKQRPVEHNYQFKY